MPHSPWGIVAHLSVETQGCWRYEAHHPTRRSRWHRERLCTSHFDQCALLVALLRAAGDSPQYRYGLQGVVYYDANGNDLVQWLGLSPTALAHLSWSQALAQYNVSADPWPTVTDQQRKKNHLLATAFLQSRGTPQVLHEPNLTRLWLPRVWVRVTVNTVTYDLDPAFTPHQVVQGMQLQAAGYDRAAVLQAVGGTSCRAGS